MSADHSGFSKNTSFAANFNLIRIPFGLQTQLRAVLSTTIPHLILSGIADKEIPPFLRFKVNQEIH